MAKTTAESQCGSARLVAHRECVAMRCSRAVAATARPVCARQACARSPARSSQSLQSALRAMRGPAPRCGVRIELRRRPTANSEGD
jgi:hypothetical protein